MQKIFAATGHRPKKLGGYGNDVFDRLVILAETFLRKKKPDSVISGMALGWDQAFAQAAINLGIPFTAAIPCLGQESRWPQPSKTKYHQILEQARTTHLCFKGSWAENRGCMQVRNRWMVDNAHSVVALWDGTSGGTANCVKYAEERNRPIFNLWEIWKKM